MLSWRMRVAALMQASQPVIGSGDRPLLRRLSTRSRSSALRSRRAPPLPTPRGGLLLGVGRLIADLLAAIALQFPRDARTASDSELP